MTGQIKLDTKFLDDIMGEVKKKYEIKVGILAGKDARKGDNSNATIGLKHEFGSISENIPSRSFIRVPLMEKLPERKAEIARVSGEAIKQKNFKKVFVKIGSEALDIIDGAFRTGGYGKWKPLSERRIKEKEEQGLSENILMATTQLRRAQTFEVIKK